MRLLMLGLMAPVAVALAAGPGPAAPQAAADPDPVSLTVSVTGATGKKGKVFVVVFDKAAGFPGDDRKAWKVEALDPAKPTVTFDKVRPGSYSVVAFLDRNGNGRLDLVPPFGIPGEPVGVSKFPKLGPATGMPTFAKAAVKVSKDTTVEVPLVSFTDPE